MVDAVDLPLVQHRAEPRVQLPRGLEVAAEGLLDDHAPPARAFLARQPSPTEPLDDGRKEIGRHGEVEEHVAPGPVAALHFLQELAELGIGLVVGELAGLVVEGVPQLAPELLVHRAGGELADLLRLLGAERLVGLGLPRDADDRELARQEPVGLQVVERGEELALGQVPGGAEDDDGAGPRHPQRRALTVMPGAPSRRLDCSQAVGRDHARLGHAPRLGDGAPGRKRRVALEDLGDAPEAVVAQVMRHGQQVRAGGLPVPVHPQVGEGKWAEQPSPCRALVIGAVALGRSAP